MCATFPCVFRLRDEWSWLAGPEIGRLWIAGRVVSRSMRMTPKYKYIFTKGVGERKREENTMKRRCRS